MIRKEIVRRILRMIRLRTEIIFFSLTDAFPFRTDPIIVLGMHKSGTRLVSRLLNNMGVYMGNDLVEIEESSFFLDLNERILKKFGASWDNPANMTSESMEGDKDYSLLKDEVCSLIRSKTFLSSYLNSFGFMKLMAFKNKSKFPWGFKDPRTTLTWRVYKEIFPNAKYIFLYKNGIDVANSLVSRENRIFRKSGKYFSNRCSSLKGAFKLWQDYYHFFNRETAEMNNLPMLDIPFEGMLQDPGVFYERVCSFVGLASEPERKNEFIMEINPAKRYAFLQDPQLRSFYEEVKDTPVMKNLRYDRIVD